MGARDHRARYGMVGDLERRLSRAGGPGGGGGEMVQPDAEAAHDTVDDSRARGRKRGRDVGAVALDAQTVGRGEPTH
ncbi:MAG: hypothetical protein E6G57_16395, partial [Actinobacteria bacterium]